MSLALLLEKYDVSTEEGLQKALNEIEKEENDVDDALSSALSRASTLEGKLRTASQAYTKLGAVKADAQTAEDMVVKTATLAQDVSAKVRQLDLARSRVAECQRRVHDLIDLQLCCAGVEAAIKAHDYETGAQHVARFLSLAPGSVAAARAQPGAPHPRAAMAAAAGTLREHLVTKFTEACGRADEAAVWRLARLFPQIGCAREGVDLLAQYLAKQVDTQIRKLCKIPDASSETAFADAFSVIVECGGGAVKRLCAACPPGSLPHALKHLQPAVSAAARRLYTEMCSARQLNSILTGGGGGGGGGSSAGGGGGGGRRPTPLAVEPALAELATAHAAIKMYFAFLMRQAEADAATLDEAARLESVQAVERIISDSDLLRTAQDILGHYLALERYFLEESVNKAIKMSSGTATSSLVDDVFFIARKVIRRSLSTGSVDGACAVLNDAASLLELSVASELRRALRAAPPDTLPLAAPGAGGGGGELGLRMNRELEAQRQLFLAQLNEAEAGAEWSMRLATEAVAEASPLLASDRDRDKLSSVAAGLGGAAAALRGARAAGLAALRAGLRPRLLAWADALADAEGGHDDDDTEADALPSALDSFYCGARAALSAAAADELLLAAVTDLTVRAEARILHHTYDRESGILVERRARRLAAWAGGAGGGAARERAARLTRAAGLLALDAAGQAAGGARGVPPPRAREILARRSDFKIEDIKRLKL